MTTELRPYQLRNVDQIGAMLAEAARGTLYVAPTGSGKTVVFADVVRQWAQRGEPVMIEVHRQELMKQASRALAAAGVPHGFIAQGQPFTSHLVQVASIDTVISRIGALRPWLASVGLYVRDEAHHSTASGRQVIRKQTARAKLLGVTATPYRSDGAGLGDEFDNSVAAPDAATLTELGWLAPFRGYQPKPPRGLSFQGIRKSGGDYAAGALGRLMINNAITDPVVRFHVEHAGRRPTVVFCASIEHAQHAAERWEIVGKLRAVAIDGSMRRKRSRHRQGDQVEAALADLAEGAIDVIMSCQLIDEGLDVSRVACGVDLARTLSTGRLQQRIGRTRRPDEEYSDALWIDAVGNLRDHGMPDEIRPWSLLQGVKNLERTVARPVTCHRCRRVQPVTITCVECGTPFADIGAPPARSDVAYSNLSAGIRSCSAVTLKTMPQREVLALAKTEADLRHVAQIRGYKPNWVKIQLDYRERMRSRFSGARRTG